MRALLDAVLSQSQQPENTEDNCYLKNGLKICHQCDTPREVEQTFGPHTRKVTCNCRCQTEAYEKRKAQQNARIEAERLSDHRKAYIQDSAMTTMCFEKDKGYCPNTLPIAKNYVANFDTLAKDEIGLLLYGDVGTGKTFVAGCIGNALYDMGYKVFATSLSRMRTGLPSEFDTQRNRNDYIDSFGRYDLLIIDDFGVERNTDYVMECIFHLIDARYKSGKPTIITTNIPLSQIKNPQDTTHKRIYDRILAMTVPLLFEGTSLRPKLHNTKLNN
ncbi:MAG: ATP-binding protein, partial [Eubacterium sp.]